MSSGSFKLLGEFAVIRQRVSYPYWIISIRRQRDAAALQLAI